MDWLRFGYGIDKPSNRAALAFLKKALGLIVGAVLPEMRQSRTSCHPTDTAPCGLTQPVIAGIFK